MFDLSGRVAMATGANGGIGLAMAAALGRAGASVMIVGRNRDKCEAAARGLKSSGLRADHFVADLTGEDACKAAVDATLSSFGRLDILVNCAGITIRKAPEDLTLAEWNTVLATNLSAGFLCAQAALPAMREQGGGKIVNVGSMHMLFAAPHTAAYAASKGGLLQLTKSLAAAWAKYNIQVNAVLPGYIETDLLKSALQQVPGLEQRVLARTPAARWGRPEDIDGAVVFLASRASDFVTGSSIVVDGGYSIYG
jgi:2-deoxy-D-gluconate 3-dehydrogenase